MTNFSFFSYFYIFQLSSITIKKSSVIAFSTKMEFFCSTSNVVAVITYKDEASLHSLIWIWKRGSSTLSSEWGRECD